MALAFRQDPRSPRKSAMDLFKAGAVCLTPLASLHVRDWDYEDRRRVMIQHNRNYARAGQRARGLVDCPSN